MQIVVLKCLRLYRNKIEVLCDNVQRCCIGDTELGKVQVREQLLGDL